MKKLLSLLAVSILALAGCSDSSSTGDVTELTMGTWAGGEELEELQAIVDEVNTENEAFNVTITSIPADYYMKIQTQASAGQAPDIMWMEQNQLAPFASESVIVPIDDYISSSDFMKDFNITDEINKTAQFEGATYGIPWISNPVIMYYNKDLLSDEDIAIMDGTLNGDYIDWEEFYTLAAKHHTDSTNGVLFNGWPPFEMFSWAFGGDIEDENGNVVIDSPENQNAVDFLTKAVVTDPITPDMETINAVGYTETFQQGNTAFFFGGVADKVELIGEEPIPFELGYAVVPGEATFNWTASTVITKDAENPEVAYQALEAITHKTWLWKAVPPFNVTELGFADYDAYFAELAPHKVGMGPVIEGTSNVIRSANFTANSARVYGSIWDHMYSQIFNAGVVGNELDNSELLKDAQTNAE